MLLCGSFLKKEDKLKIVSFIYDENGFLIKGAIDQVANELQVSGYTVYNYFEDLKAKKMEIAKYLKTQ